MTSPAILRATTADLPDIEKLLEDSALPLAGLRDHLEHFFMAREGTRLIGAVGLELYGREGLLRSLAVRRSECLKGIGSTLMQHAIAEARRLGAKRLILLTTTAERYFSRWGFRTIERSTITGELTRSAEFTGACPASAVCMELLLNDK
jgi:amino-acid N-acetyltransferase